MKIVLQHDERDCGAACLAMIAAYYRLFLPISTCREITKTSKTGANLYGLTDGAGKLGLRAEALSGSHDELLDGISKGEIVLPFVAHTLSDDTTLHYVVVFEKKGNSFVIGDPAKGKVVLPISDFLEHWTGYIVTFRRSDEFKTGDFTRWSFLKFFKLLKGQWASLAGVLIASLFVAVVGISSAFTFQILIDHLEYEGECYEEHEHGHAQESDGLADSLEHSSEDSSAISRVLDRFVETIGGKFHFIFCALLVLYLLRAMVHFVRSCLIIHVSKTVDLRLMLRYYNHIVDLPVSSLSLRQTGEYLSRFSDCSSIRQAISGATVTLLFDSLMAIVGAIVLFLESSQLFFVTLGMVLFYAVLVLRYRKPIETSNRRVMEEDARLQSFFKESIDGMETVKAANAEDRVKNTTTLKFHRLMDALVKSSMIGASQDALVETVDLVGSVMILWIGFAMVFSGQVTVGVMVTFYVLLSIFTEPIKNLIELQPKIQTAFVAADRLNDILELKTEQIAECDNKGEALPEQVKCWEACHVDFRYGNHELTLQDVNFKIDRGERVAIVGESGSGKTTLAKLFLRFYEPESGGLFLDGVNLSKYSLKALRDRIAYVSQDTFFFSDTIRNNLSLGNPLLTDDEMRRACELSKTQDFIDHLPLKFDTPLEENGSNLSGGQRQRLAIARAIARHPQLLILDEATSNLDTVTENGIRDTVFRMDKSMTCIIIAHRLTTIRSCDRIYVMKNGTVVETGTYDELMKAQGEFYRLWVAM